jgi:hypothetical protein
MSSPLRLMARFFPQLNTCGHSPYITSSLTRGGVCHLQLLLVLGSAFILGSESRGSRDHILLSQIRDFPFCRLLRLAGLRWRYSTPPPHGISSQRALDPRYIDSGGPQQKTPFPNKYYIVTEVFNSPLHKKGSSYIVACKFISAVIYSSSLCLVMNVYYGSAIPTFKCHVIIYYLLYILFLLR